YSTACVGKWHLGEDWSRIRTPLKKGAKPPKGKTVFKDKKNSATYDFTQPILEGPNERGFDYYFGTSVPNFPPYCFIENDHTVGIPTLAKPDTMFGHPGPMIKGWDLTQIMPGLFNKANSWVKTEAAKKDKPFFLYLPLTGPHTPIAPTKEFQGKTKAGWYGDFIHQIDHHIGTLMKTLADSGEADNTLVIFTSDNGSPARLGTGDMAGNKMTVHKTGHIPAGDWRGLKSDAWEGGHRVPFIVVWPGKTPAGKTSKEPISSVDLIATLAAVTGYTLPDTTAQDSHNLLDLFTGKPVGIDAGKPALREAIVHHSGGGMFCLRQGSWKLICGLGSGGFSGKGPASLRPKGAKGQLYNLKLDPKENDNLWLKQPKKVAKLTAILNKYKKTGRSAPLRHKK
ncbi:MAG: sulfatase-like hydrolase/transferase, partial [Phycisphaerales bacterium]|nr:sulfatase-like hydrolase/transferase [Phycisphaerales bacterium]